MQIALSVTGRTVVMVMRVMAKLPVYKKGANKVEKFDLYDELYG